MNTSCKNCHYAIYEGITQIGCKLNRIDKWQQQTEVLEAYDEEKEFYVIKDRVCNAYNEWTYYDLTDVYDIIKLPYTLLIWGNKQQIEDSLKFSVNIPPKKILLGGKEKLKFDHSYTYFLEDLSDEQMERELAKKCKTEFYIPLSGDTLDSDFVDKCEDIYNEQLKKFVYIQGKNTLKLQKSVVWAGASRDKLIEAFGEELCLQV